MSFITGKTLAETIKRIMSSSQPRAAVAFWGKGADSLFASHSKDVRIICNLRMGGTNPKIIETLMKKDGFTVHQHNTLHAKVYFNNESAIVTSANASINGLGLEAKEQANWEEAGQYINDKVAVKKIGIWFEKLWKSDDCNPISPEDIQDAKKLWRPHKSARPTLRSFADFELEDDYFPLLNWFDFVEDQPNVIINREVTKDDEILESRIEAGLQVDGKEDIKAYSKGRWILWFERTSKGMPSRKRKLEWQQLSVLIKNAKIDENENIYYDVVLSAERPDPIPFEVESDDRFKGLFLDMLKDEKFKELITKDIPGAWVTDERHKLMKEFWLSLHEAYLRKS